MDLDEVKSNEPPSSDQPKDNANAPQEAYREAIADQKEPIADNLQDHRSDQSKEPARWESKEAFRLQGESKETSVAAPPSVLTPPPLPTPKIEPPPASFTPAPAPALTPAPSVPFTPAVESTHVPQATPAGYKRKASLWISPRLLQWTVRISAIVLFILLFLPWVGVYPAGYGVYTQTALQSIAGGVSTDPVGVKALYSAKPFDNVSGSGMMLLYVVLVIFALILVIGPIVLDAAQVKTFPGFAQFFWRRRVEALGLTALFALIILVAQISAGFGLENAVYAKADKDLAAEIAAAQTPEEKQAVEIHQAVQVGPYHLKHTNWLRLAVILHVLLLVGVALQYWLKRRGDRPLPLIEAHA